MKIKKHKYSISILLVWILVLLLGSCHKNDRNTIRIGVLEGPSAISIVKMINKPVLIEGKKVEIIIKSDPQQIQALMIRNELDFAVLPTVMAANLYNKGLKYKVIGCPIWGTLYIVTNQPNIETLEELSGHTISVFGQGATPDILLQRELKQKGILNVKYDYSYTGNKELAQALLQNNAKIAVVSEPMVSMLLAKDKNIRIVGPLTCEEFIQNSDMDIFVQSSFVVNPRFVENNYHLIPKIRELYANSCNFVTEQPNQAARMLVDNGLISDYDIAKRAIPLCNIRYVGAFALEREINRYLNIFYEFDPKCIGGKIPPRDFIYQ